MKSSSMPTSAREPPSAPMPAPIAIPRMGTKKIIPNRNPQNAPLSAPAPPMLWSWRVWGFLRSSGQLTTAASCRVISWRSCMPCKATSTRSAPPGSLNFSTESVAIAFLLFSLVPAFLRHLSRRNLGRSGDFVVLDKPKDDEYVERNDYNRQHGRHWDVKEPSDDAQDGEAKAREESERSAAEDAEPRV